MMISSIFMAKVLRGRCGMGDGYWCHPDTIPRTTTKATTKPEKCKKDECWCISKGGNSCSHRNGKPKKCDDDECWASDRCDEGDGYWCHPDTIP